MDYSRILDLLNPKHFENKHVLAIGCGSGNSTAIAELVKNGVQNFYLWDNDVLEPVNLVRHLLGRRYLNRNKAEAMKEWILDRNEKANVRAFPLKYQDSEDFFNLIKKKDMDKLILIGVDNNNDRLQINRIAVEHKIPFVLGMVFRRGVGGMVFRYIPNETGCYYCLNMFAKKNGLIVSSLETERTNHTEEEIYGLGLERFKKSPGLSIDIGFISLIMARLALDTLLKDVDTDLPKIRSNLIVFSNRHSEEFGFKKTFCATHFLLKPQEGCMVCGGPEK